MKIGKIEKNIPIPETRSSKYSWADIEVGGSVSIATSEDENLDILRNRVSKSIHKFNRRTGRKLRSMSIREDNEVRVWRTE
jgi:hypothetical protein